MITQRNRNKGNSINWKDYVGFLLLALPIILIAAWPVPRSIAHSIVTFVSLVVFQ